MVKLMDYFLDRERDAFVVGWWYKAQYQRCRAKAYHECFTPWRFMARPLDRDGRVGHGRSLCRRVHVAQTLLAKRPVRKRQGQRERREDGWSGLCQGKYPTPQRERRRAYFFLKNNKSKLAPRVLWTLTHEPNHCGRKRDVCGTQQEWIEQSEQRKEPVGKKKSDGHGSTHARPHTHFAPHFPCWLFVVAHVLFSQAQRCLFYLTQRRRKQRAPFLGAWPRRRKERDADPVGPRFPPPSDQRPPCGHESTGKKGVTCAAEKTKKPRCQLAKKKRIKNLPITCIISPYGACRLFPPPPVWGGGSLLCLFLLFFFFFSLALVCSSFSSTAAQWHRGSCEVGLLLGLFTA